MHDKAHLIVGTLLKTMPKQQAEPHARLKQVGLWDKDANLLVTIRKEGAWVRAYSTIGTAVRLSFRQSHASPA